MKGELGGLHRIAAVARQTGVSGHALRIWERRYGALASHRSPAGYRLYTDEDVARVSAIKNLLDLGFAVGEVASLPLAELLRQLEKSRNAQRMRPSIPLVESMRRRFLDSIAAFDREESKKGVAGWPIALAPFELVTELVAPVLAEVGNRWQRGELSIAQEHAASALIRGLLSDVLTQLKPGRDAPVIVATTPSDEAHEMGALMAAVVAATAGARIVYLGPNLPSAETASAVKNTDAVAVMISVVCLDERLAARHLSELRKALPRQVALWVGGGSIQRSPEAGIHWIQTFEELRLRVNALAK